MLKQVIVVEGKNDAHAVRRAVDADIIITGGFTLNKKTLAQIEIAYHSRGIIILTDPDRAGENIRKFLSERFPLAQHAFVPKNQAYKNNDIGIEQAQPTAIKAALAKLHTKTMELRQEFNISDLLNHELTGSPKAAERRDELGALLNIGYAGAKQFIQRLNNYNISREEFIRDVKKLTDIQRSEPHA